MSSRSCPRRGPRCRFPPTGCLDLKAVAAAMPPRGHSLQQRNEVRPGHNCSAERRVNFRQRLSVDRDEREVERPCRIHVGQGVHVEGAVRVGHGVQAVDVQTLPPEVARRYGPRAGRPLNANPDLRHDARSIGREDAAGSGMPTGRVRNRPAGGSAPGCQGKNESGPPQVDDPSGGA